MKKDKKLNNPKPKLWNFWNGFLYAIFLFIVSQFLPLVLVLYPILLENYSFHQSLNWLSSSIYAQFLAVLIYELFTIIFVFYFLRRKKLKKDVLGLRKFYFSDILYGFIGIFLYFVVYYVILMISASIFKNLNLNQKQNIGFNTVSGFWELVVTFVSLVILAPIAEEILFRGFLYTTFKIKLPKIWAALLTSIIFASLHLPEGVGGLLWAGAIDTFTLSMVLIYLREKTNGLYSGMIVHGLKNGLAFFILYMSPIIAIVRFR